MDSKPLQHQFDACYQAESDAIFRFCLVRVSDREQAVDLTQETFVRLWKTLLQGEEIKNKRAFLFTVTHRLIIDWYRKKKAVSLDAMTTTEDGEANEFGDGRNHADLEIEAEGRHLLNKIQQLNESYRQVVYLRFIEGLSPPEIAEILNISPNNVSVRINRGLKELREITGYDEKEK